jgi:hypothetical protein
MTESGPEVDITPQSAMRKSTAQEQPDLFEEPIGSRLMLQEQMVLTLERDESGARNASSELAAGLERNHLVVPRMHDKRRRHLAHRDEFLIST